jgi:hypothetical protein
VVVVGAGVVVVVAVAPLELGSALDAALVAELERGAEVVGEERAAVEAVEAVEAVDGTEPAASTV